MKIFFLTNVVVPYTRYRSADSIPVKMMNYDMLLTETKDTNIQ